MKRFVAANSIVGLLTIVSCQMPGGTISAGKTLKPPPVLIEGENIRGFHVSTRPHNRKVIYDPRSGYRFVFYGHGGKDPDGRYRISWRSSKDGLKWSDAHTAFEGNAHSSSTDVLLTKDKISMLIFRPHYYRRKAGLPEVREGRAWYDCPEDNFFLPYEICQYKIQNGDLIPGKIFTVMAGSAFDRRPHYGSLTRDSKGYFWVGARALSDDGREQFEAWVSRSVQADDISEWQSPQVLYQAKGEGTLTVQVVALDEGRVYCVLFSQPDVGIYGTLYDPQRSQWESPYLISEGNAASKRAVASFDPGSRRLHLVYIDNAGTLRHKILAAPYRQEDWSPKAGIHVPGTEIAANVTTGCGINDNISISIDTSRSPAPLVVAYHQQTPHYKLRRYNGRAWDREEIPIGMQDSTRYVDEISLIRNFSDKLGLIYYVLPRNQQHGALYFLEIPKRMVPDNEGIHEE